MKTQCPPIFGYISYRKFLSDYYGWHKVNTNGFSYRMMAEQLGFTSPNFLKLVIDGERNLGRESLEKVAHGIGLNKVESEYFAYLVFFNQAKNNVEKNYYYGLIASLKSSGNCSKIAPDQHEYFSKWYHPAVRELVAGKLDPLDYNGLSITMNEKATASQIKKSVALLLRLNLLSLNEQKVYVQPSPVLNTDNELAYAAVRYYHKETLSIAQSALDEVSQMQREFSHVTIKISDDGFSKIKKRIQEFRNEILQLASDDSNVDNVYHVNMQFYPITKSSGNEEQK